MFTTVHQKRMKWLRATTPTTADCRITYERARGLKFKVFVGTEDGWVKRDVIADNGILRVEIGGRLFTGTTRIWMHDVWDLVDVAESEGLVKLLFKRDEVEFTLMETKSPQPIY